MKKNKSTSWWNKNKAVQNMPKQPTTTGKPTVPPTLPQTKPIILGGLGTGIKTPSLRFSPYAWAKLLYLRDKTKNEVGGFGIGTPEDPLKIIDVVLVKQEVTMASVEFDSIGIADYAEDQVELGRKPNEYFRVWLHTHPGMSAHPSLVDIGTFNGVFGDCTWSVMAILATDDKMLARIQFNNEIKAQFMIEAKVDYSIPFSGADQEAWDEEYDRLVEEAAPVYFNPNGWKGYNNYTNVNGYFNKNRMHAPVEVELLEEEEEELTTAELIEEEWPLEEEIMNRTPEDAMDLLIELEIRPEDVWMYECSMDDKGYIVATKVFDEDDLVDEEADEVAEKIIMHGYAEEE